MSDTLVGATDRAGDSIDGTHVDVLIIGAGISGIGAAHHLREQRPGTSFVILEALETFGGTWWTHRYPGIRSDSDLFTFGYRFKPWTGPPIAEAGPILDYLREVMDEDGTEEHIRYRHRVRAASWSSAERRWTVQVHRADTDDQVTMTAGFLWMCQGYYRHEQGYTPEWDGMEDFAGPIVHPQTWPADLDLHGKRVVVIGSGATAATLVPAIIDDVEHVTMLQRSPTFFYVRPNANELADTLRQLDVPEAWTHEIVRRKILFDQAELTRFSLDFPDEARALLLDQIRPLLPEGFDVDTHFNPSYDPWRQRIAVVPEGDLFAGIRSGKASVVTDHIERFTERGIRLKSGEELEADVIITATGFDLSVMGDIAFEVDGRAVDWADAITYRGLMFTGVPNLVYVFGYFRYSWTLRADIISDFVCRLLDHLDELGASEVVPELRPEDRELEVRPWIEATEFNPGYLQRSIHLMPKQLSDKPFRLSHDYPLEKEELAAADLDDGILRYS